MEEKKRIGFYLDTKLLQQADELLDTANVRSRNEFVNAALNFYIGFLTSGTIEDYLLQSLSSVLTSVVQDTENRIARMEFKMAVEVSMLAHLVAFHSNDDIDPMTFKKLFLKCIDEVKHINGSIDLESAYRYQKRKEN